MPIFIEHNAIDDIALSIHKEMGAGIIIEAHDTYRRDWGRHEVSLQWGDQTLVGQWLLGESNPPTSHEADRDSRRR